MVALFGLPTARVLQAGASTSVEIGIDHSNIFAGGLRSDEALRLDGETSTAAIYASQRISRCWHAGIETSFVSHVAGSLDGPIERWHDIFALPAANRSETPQDLIEFHYRIPGHNLELIESGGGIGDTSLHLMLSGACWQDLGVPGTLPGDSAIRFGLKLPTGELTDFTGSGTTDAYLEYVAGATSLSKSLALRSRVGLLFTGSSSRLPERRDVAAFSTLVLGWRAMNKLSLTGQLDLHSPLYRSELTEIGHWALQLALGARVDLGRGRGLDLAFFEDLVIDTAPDIVLHVSYTQRF